MKLTQGEKHRIEICRHDGGPEFEGEFEEGLQNDNTISELSHPNKGKTNAGIERYVRIVVEGT